MVHQMLQQSFHKKYIKLIENQQKIEKFVTFELAAVFDLAGIRAPKRQCTRAEFPSIGTIAIA